MMCTAYAMMYYMYVCIFYGTKHIQILFICLLICLVVRLNVVQRAVAGKIHVMNENQILIKWTKIQSVPLKRTEQQQQ